MRIIFCLSFLVVTACSVDPVTEKRIDLIEVSKIQEMVLAWLECDDCIDGEFDSLLSLGDNAVDPLINSLEKGPSPARLMAFENHLKDSYRAILEYQRAHSTDSINIPFSVYSKNYISNYYATYQMRSAIALGRIRSPRGIEAIRRLLQSDSELRPEVENVLEEVLRSF